MSNDMNTFISVDNMQNLIQIMSRFLNEKHNLSTKELVKSGIHLKKELFKHIQMIYNDPKAASVDLLRLNQTVLKKTKDAIIGVIQQSVLSREKDIYGDRPTPDTRIQSDFVVKASGINSDIDKQFERLSASRQHEQTFESEKKKMTLETVSIMEEAIDDNEFQHQYNRMISEREIQIEIDNANAEASNSKSKKPGNEPGNVKVGNNRRLTEDMNTLNTTPKRDPKEFMEMLQKPPSFMQKLNSNLKTSSSTQESFEDNTLELGLTSASNELESITPSEQPLSTIMQLEEQDDGISGAYIMHNNNPITSMDGTYAAYDNDRISDRRDFINITAPTHKLDETFMIINSGDRSFETFPNKYSFRVRFEHASNSEQQFEIYENNPTVPNFTKSPSRSAQQNVNGWTHPVTNVTYPPYDSQFPYGNIVGYETIVLGVENGAYVEKVLKNIHSISFKKIIIPNELGLASAFQSEHQFSHFSFNFPYVLLKVDEFSNLIGTNDTIRRCACQFEYSNSFNCPNGRGYITLEPVQNEVVIFAPLLKATLNTMTLSIIKPNGELLSDNSDGNFILKIEHELSNPYYLKVVLKHYFEKNAYYIGDYVQIRNYIIYNISPNMSDNEIQALVEFMNKPEGHEIKQIGEANEFGMFNSFFISAPVTVDTLKGTKCVNDPLVNQIEYYNCNMVDFSITIGSIINMSLQISVSLSIKTQEYDMDKNLASDAI